MNNTLILRGGESLARDTRTVFELLEKLQGGLLEVRLPDGSSALFGDGEAGVTLHVHDEAMFGQILSRGDIGTVRLVGQVISVAIVTMVLSLEWSGLLEMEELVRNIEISFVIFIVLYAIILIAYLRVVLGFIRKGPELEGWDGGTGAPLVDAAGIAAVKAAEGSAEDTASPAHPEKKGDE